MYLFYINLFIIIKIIAYGGLPTSMLTDRVQGWAIILLIAIATVTIFSVVKIDSTAVDNSGLLQPSRIAIESFYVLTAACTGANLFHQVSTLFFFSIY